MTTRSEKRQRVRAMTIGVLAIAVGIGALVVLPALVVQAGNSSAETSAAQAASSAKEGTGGSFQVEVAGSDSEVAAGQEEGEGGAYAETGSLSDAGGGVSASDAGAETDGTEVSSTWGSAGACPVVVPAGREEAYRDGPAGSSWSFTTDVEAEDLAASLIGQLQEASWSLVESGYLGLGDDAWGCVARSAEESRVLLVYGIPQILGASRGDDNPLKVSVLLLQSSV